MDNYEVNVLTRKGGWKKLPQEVVQNKNESRLNISDNLKMSRDKIINEIQNLSWENGFYRKDIGFKIIEK